MKSMFSCLILIILVFKSNSLLPPEKREELMNKYTRKINLESFDPNKNYFNSNNALKDGFDYDPQQISGNLEYYGFEKNFSFLEAHGITPNVKNQGKCGCCWSHSATTALAYRFKLKNLDIDLSPQDALSCYLRDCDYGNYLIDTQLNLIKNGTVTEQCLPFSSSEGVITDECPTKCKDGSDIKKYHSQNAYKTEETVTQTNFYDIVLLIIDQLVNRGPVVASIIVYQDFVDLSKDQTKCKNTVYRYNGKAEELGGHAVAVVGYGYLEGKYYWLIQNSWGPNSCDGGFIKVEFGQIGVEDVAFAEPYLEEQGKEPVEIKLNYNKMDENCNIEVSLENTADIEKWKNSLEFQFQSENTKSIFNFNFQCGILSSEKVNKKIACYYDYLNWDRPINYYKYKGFQSLGKDNTFNLGSSSSQIKDFNFYGYDTIYPYIPGQLIEEQIFFVSEEGSRINFYFDEIDAGKDYLPPIYANSKSQTPLSDCERKTFVLGQTNHNIIICSIKSNELDYFVDNYPTKDSMSYAVLCGAKEEISTYAYKLDKTKYPIFRVKDVNLEKTMNLTAETSISFAVGIEGNPSDFNDQYFMAFADIEYDNKNETYNMMCMTGIPEKNISEKNMTCQINIAPQEGEKNFTNVYFYPYFYPYFNEYMVYSPYEIIMKDVIKKENEFYPKPEPKPTGSSNNLKSSLMFVLLFIILFI